MVRFLNFQRLLLYGRNHRVILHRSASAMVCYPITSWFMIRNLFTALSHKVIHWTCDNVSKSVTADFLMKNSHRLGKIQAVN